jgi:lipopolysaccharide/colanic/teichoic acid biosynthesis glycosyltransferase
MALSHKTIDQAEGIVNARRSGSNGVATSPLSETPALEERGTLNAVAFRRMIALERKRSERSRKPFMLLLLDMVDRPSQKNGKILNKVLSVLSTSTRDTDVTGWYTNDRVVGVMFTEIAIEESAAIPGTILARVTETLRTNLAFDQFNRVCISFHVFPEDWDDEDRQRPSNPTLYPDLSQREDTRKAFRAVKRVMDVAGSILALILFLPVFLAVACAVKATSEGPVFFRQRRVGQHGKSFVFLKFRSMYTNNDAAVHKKYVQELIAGKAEKQPASGNGNGVYKLTGDSRITRVGAFLRKTSLDELPQFINVLKGEMSLVGPRPPVPYEVEAYDIWHRRRLLEAKPGITGLWQVSGRSRVKFDDMVRLDLRYARTWSPWIDMKILWRTPGAVVLGNGAH